MGLKNCHDAKAFNEYSNDTDDIYENIYEYLLYLFIIDKYSLKMNNKRMIKIIYNYFKDKCG